MFKQIRCAVLLNANTFIPSIVSQLWLVEKGIVVKEDFQGDCIYANEISQTQTKSFNLVIIPPQLQFVLKAPESEWASTIDGVLGKFVDSLPATPYSALGLNFDATISPSESNPREIERTLFFGESIPFRDEFTEEDCRYGGYFSKDFLDGRLKLDIKPGVRDVEGENQDVLRFAFNFHRDLPEDRRVEVVREHLAHAGECLAKVHSIIGKVEE